MAKNSYVDPLYSPLAKFGIVAGLAFIAMWGISLVYFTTLYIVSQNDAETDIRAHYKVSSISFVKEDCDPGFVSEKCEVKIVGKFDGKKKSGKFIVVKTETGYGLMENSRFPLPDLKE